MSDRAELIWEPGALEDLSRLREFLTPKNPKAAANAARAILHAANRLQDFPYLGRPIPNLPEFYELIIPFGRNGYVIRYRLDNNFIVILRVWHGREERE